MKKFIVNISDGKNYFNKVWMDNMKKNKDNII